MNITIKLGTLNFKTTEQEVAVQDFEIGVEDIKLTEIPSVITAVKEAIMDIESVQREQANDLINKREERQHELQMARLAFDEERRNNSNSNRITELLED